MIRALFARLRRARARTAALAELRAMDAHQLRDLGIEPGEIGAYVDGCARR
ncbi:MAG: DUF1127 domain-containing protein [Paracoccaceae bacterium]